MSDVTFYKDILTIAGGIVLLLTFLRSTVEYVRQGAQKRVELFLSVEKAFRENAKFQEIRTMITNNNPEISKYEKKARSDYAGFFEQIALLKNSRLIRKEVACYMFSCDAILCWENEAFWDGFDKSDKYWGLLRIFVEEMKRLRDVLRFTKKDFRL